MITEMDINIPTKVFRGDTLIIDCHINVDLTNYDLHAELFDRFYSSISLDTEGLGGEVGEIIVASGNVGTFTLNFAKDLTNLFHLNSYLEIKLIDEDGNEQTVWYDIIKFTDNQYFRC